MINISIDEAYQEACAALGEAIVRERLLTKALAEYEASAAPPESP